MKPMPALTAKMGSTPYWLTTMDARTLVSVARPARETDSWASASIEERMQREADFNRIRKHIVPYLAQHPDRFFGAVIVLVEKGAIEWESLTDVAKGLSKAYASEVDSMGFLFVKQGEHIVLDGQHRWIALRDVITSGQTLGQYQSKVGDDDIVVIFIENEDNRKTRRIFNKVNRHAKPTGRSDNILTSEDDGYAWIARRLLDKDEPLAAIEVEDGEAEIVNWRSTTLSRGMRHLTTISAVYDTVRHILAYEGVRDLDRIVTPSDDELQEAYDLVAPWWAMLLEEVQVFAEVLGDLDSVKHRRFDADDRYTLLLRPVGQITAVRGLVKAMEVSRDPRTKEPQLSLATAIARLNEVDWSARADSVWRGSILKGDGKMVARSEAMNQAANLLAYLIAPEGYTDEMRAALWRAWNLGRDKDVDTPVAQLEAEGRDDIIPDDLPAPVA